jgi:hypothetical protein
MGYNPGTAYLPAVLFTFPSASGRLSPLATPTTARNPSGASDGLMGFFKAD